MFVGREQELAALEEAQRAPGGQLVVLYGRRRIGKSSLVAEFTSGKSHVLSFEALEDESTSGQIKHFLAQLGDQAGEPLIATAPVSGWKEAFDLLTKRALPKSPRRNKPIVFLDELQWMAAGRSGLVSLLKYFWDRHWKPRGVTLILCGSIASFMIDKVIRSRALYGRITLELLLHGLAPHEATQLFRGKRSPEEILKYQLVFGGVPRYLEDIRLDRSFNYNMNRLCFAPGAVMLREMERIFYSQFREHRTYHAIVTQLAGGLLSLAQIGRAIGMPSGGGLRRYLRVLEDADILSAHVPVDRSAASKIRKYSLSDEYLRFHYKYIEPNRRAIEQSGSSAKLFERLTAGSFDPWLGLAFERFCLKHSVHLARLMGFADDVLHAAPSFGRGDEAFQIDLVYRRADKVITVCEIKHHVDPVGTKVIPEVQRKCDLLRIPRGYALETALISLHGASEPLTDSEFFDYVITLDDILAEP